MHRRALHLASLFLLLASMSTAEAATLREGSPAFAAPYVRVLIAQQEAAVAAARSALASASARPPLLDIPPAARAQVHAAWSMRSPNAQTTRVHASTASLL